MSFKIYKSDKNFAIKIFQYIIIYMRAKLSNMSMILKIDK